MLNKYKYKLFLSLPYTLILWPIFFTDLYFCQNFICHQLLPLNILFQIRFLIWQ